MHLSNLLNLTQFWLIKVSLVIAQATPSPTNAPKSSPTPSTDVELLKTQLQFLQDANTRLNNSFGSFVSAINLSFVVFGLIFAIVGAVSVYLFNQSLKEARQMVREEVERRVQISVSEVVGQQVNNLKQILDREEVLGNISIDYILPQDQALIVDDYPEEYQLLAERGFKTTRILDASKRFKIIGNVVVLDLVNYQLVKDSERGSLKEAEISQLIEQRVDDKIKEVVKSLSNKAVLIVYIRPGKQRINAIDELSQKVRYYASANTPVNLMGTVVDSAYVADAWNKV
ncbi:hypothetical protein HCG51_11360 [Tolypothrix sp. PCC 7910]|uniref:hypothetical protein n=1 Tax=Tolypothrix sp. PCC 7910 TaxID=2099387 RepID=UPI00142794B1|nr:hypothetical protein [Tolypothrix sp. PCC 7910]QIR37252.1 hypothetical protein HCG51_11360 [Tolypothrix sp. PCC 7910]